MKRRGTKKSSIKCIGLYVCYFRMIQTKMKQRNLFQGFEFLEYVKKNGKSEFFLVQSKLL